MFLIEILLPPLFFVGGLPRQLAAVACIGLMVGIQLTGNFGYFNLLTSALAIAVLDPVSAYAMPNYPHLCAGLVTGGWAAVTRELVLAFALPPFFVATLFYFLFNSWVNLSFLSWPTIAAAAGGFWGNFLGCLRAVAPFRVMNAFGVFPPNSTPPLRYVCHPVCRRARTRAWCAAPSPRSCVRHCLDVRWVVLVEGSDDGGVTWKEYHWRFMTSGPGDEPSSAPRCVAPHHPRIDHSIFYDTFGASNANMLCTLTGGDPLTFTPHAQPCQRIAFRLLSGDAAGIDTFFSHNPFPDPAHPPTAVRASAYIYSAVSMATWWNSGRRRWWTGPRA